MKKGVDRGVILVYARVVIDIFEEDEVVLECDVKPVGRPSKFEDLDMYLIQALVDKGFTDREIAMILKVNPETWYSWQRQYPDFSETLQGWKKHANERVVRSLYERAIGYEHKEIKFFTHLGRVTSYKTIIKHVPPDPGAAKLWLINRDRENWKDRREDTVEHLGELTLRWQEPKEKELPEILK